MQHSTNYNFNLPQPSDFADISDLTHNWEEADRIIGEISEAEFYAVYGLSQGETLIENTLQGKRITERNESNGVTSVTTFTPTVTGKIITTVVTPDEGDYLYTKTEEIIKLEGGGKRIPRTFTKTLKS